MSALRYTERAENDLLDAWLFIAEDNPLASTHSPADPPVSIAFASSLNCTTTGSLQSTWTTTSLHRMSPIPDRARFERATWLDLIAGPVPPSPYLKNSIDRGEASVIQTALNNGVNLVCIDEVVGRRIAHSSLTGSVGILLKQAESGNPPPPATRLAEHSPPSTPSHGFIPESSRSSSASLTMAGRRSSNCGKAVVTVAQTTSRSISK